MPFALACMTHPIGSPCGLNEDYLQRIRIGPLMSLFDTLHLIYEICHHYHRNPGNTTDVITRIQNAIREVVNGRLQRHRTEERTVDDGPPGNPQTAIPLDRFEKPLYNTPIRHLFSAVLILQYTKFCGFHGVPMSFALATGYFVSWIIMEMILLVGESNGATEPRQTTRPEQASSPPPTISKGIGRVVFFLQSMAIQVGGFMLLGRAQSGFKFVTRPGETIPRFDLHSAAFLTISSSFIYWVDSMPLFVGISLMSGHRRSRKVSDIVGIIMAILYLLILTTVFYSGWVFGASHLPFIAYVTFFYASRLFFQKPGGVRERLCRSMRNL
ncbi:hypothetical protein L873DRAFT_1819602, partial [Choiromyces venosus 120613-1]